MIKNFISTIKTQGLARTNRYTIFIPFPSTGAWAIDRNAADITTILCDSVQIPGLNISSTPSRFYGETREMPYEKVFDPITTTFYVDSKMQVKGTFDKWLAMVIDPYTRAIGYYNDYVRNIDIKVENVDGSSPMMIRLFEAYPKTVGSVQLDSGGKDVMKLSVTWQYKYWVSSTIDQPPVPVRQEDAPSVLTGSGYRLGDYITDEDDRFNA